NRNVYVRVLQTFAASNLLAGLEEYFEQEDIQNYMVLSHSIKGACRNIGANDVADMAYELEKAGKRSDMPYIWDHHREFADAYGKLLKKVTKAVLDYQNQ
ncbi:MAG: Hpt domain-containing protein, partial [Lachnospiraceae bacterium]|nr:Hpt domain-containing protein [Lachnospiraceae bacterium]